MYTVQIGLFNESGIGAFFITALLSAHELSKLLLDGLSGALADKYKPVPVMICGLSLKAIGCLMWVLSKSKISFLMGSIFIGGGRAFVYSKIEPYIYNVLHQNGGKEYFANTLFLRNLSTNITAVCSGFIVGSVYKKFGGFDGALCIGIFVITVLHIPFLIYMQKDKSMQLKYDNNKEDMQKIFKTTITLFRKNKSILYAVLIAGLANASFFIISDIYKMVSVNMRISPIVFAKIYSLAHILPIITSATLFALNRNLSTTTAIKIMIAMFLMILALGLVYNNWLIFACLLYLMAFPAIRVAVVDNLARKSGHLRFTVMSISETLTSVINVCMFLCFGTVTQCIGYQPAIMLIAGCFALCSGLLIGRMYKASSI